MKFLGTAEDRLTVRLSPAKLLAITYQELGLTLLHTARTLSSLDSDWLREVVVVRQVGLPLLYFLLIGIPCGVIRCQAVH